MRLYCGRLTRSAELRFLRGNDTVGIWYVCHGYRTVNKLSFTTACQCAYTMSKTKYVFDQVSSQVQIVIFAARLGCVATRCRHRVAIWQLRFATRPFKNTCLHSSRSNSTLFESIIQSADNVVSTQFSEAMHATSYMRGLRAEHQN